MGKKISKGITRIYIALIGMLLIVSMTGFADAGKTVTIQADGVNKVVFTHAVNGEALLRENKIPLGEADEVVLSTEDIEDGTIARVYRAVPVTVTYKGESKTILTAKQFVKDAVVQAGYNSHDYRAYGDIAAPVTKGMTIKVGKVSRKEITEDEVVPYAIESIPDETLGQGEERVLQEGVNGRKRVKIVSSALMDRS